MRETKFIEQNKEKWTEFEALLKEKNKDPDRLNQLFIEITDDLSYSRTFYPNRSVRYYLNGLAQGLFHNIYKNRSSKGSRFIRFWKEDLPQVVWESRREFLLAFFVFALAFSIGMLSCAMDIEFPRIILSDSYVDMTERNIENKDPMKVYKEQNEVDMFLGITLNNLRVSFLTFVSGILAGIGTLGVLIYNGIMVGAFQFFFYQKGVFWESFLTIWIHGTIEISAIIIAGAAGLVMGKGLIFPGTYSRLQAFQISARRGLKILMGIVPLIILAGFFEGFLTRHTEAPDILRVGIILFSALFIIGYFVWYPYRLSRTGFSKALEDEKLPPTRTEPMNYQKILTVGEIFKESFSFLNKYLRVILLLALVLSILYCGVGYLLIGDDLVVSNGSILTMVFGEMFSQLAILFDYTNLKLFAFNTLLITVVALFASYLLSKETNNTVLHANIQWREFGRFTLSNIIKILPVALLLNVLAFLPIELFVVIVFAILPICGLYLFVMVKEGMNPFSAVGRTFYLLGNGWGKMYGLFLIISMISFAFFILLNSSVVWFYFEVVQWNFDANTSTIAVVAKWFTLFLIVFIFNLVIPLIFISMGLLYFSLLEIKEAHGLKERIASLGKKRRAFGLEVEN